MRKEAQKRKRTNMNRETAHTAAAVAEQGAHVAPEKASPRKRATLKKGVPTSQKTATGKGKARKRAAQPSRTKTSSATPRAESKGAKILALIRRPKGATLAEIMKATDWQAHSVRGFISTAGKKYGIDIESSKNDADRVYSIKK